MPRLSQSEKQSLREFGMEPPHHQPETPVIPILDFLRILSSLPTGLIHEKPVRFTGDRWKL